MSQYHHEFNDSFCSKCLYTGRIEYNCPICNTSYSTSYFCTLCGEEFYDLDNEYEFCRAEFDYYNRYYIIIIQKFYKKRLLLKRLNNYINYLTEIYFNPDNNYIKYYLNKKEYRLEICKLTPGNILKKLSLNKKK